MEKLHPRKRLLNKYAGENSLSQLFQDYDSRSNVTIVEVSKPEQLNDISTTCNISPIPNWQHQIPTRNTKHQPAYHETPNDFTKDKNYFIPHLPNLEVTKVSEDNRCSYGLPMWTSYASQRQHEVNANQHVSPRESSSPIASCLSPSSLLLLAQVCESEDNCNYGSNKNLGASCKPNRKLEANRIQSKVQVDINRDHTKSIIEEKIRR